MTPRRGSATLAVALATITLTLGGCSPSGQREARPHPTSPQDAGRQLADCMKDRGWKTDVEADGGVVSEYPPEQEDRYTDDLHTCIEIVGPAEPIEYSQRQYEALYASTLEAQQCLLDKFGYETPKAPSLDAFIELKGAWSPFNLLPDISAEEFLEIQEVCPQPRL